MRRGELYWARLPEPVGQRPVLVVTRTPAIAVRNAVTVAPVTRTIRGIASELLLGREHGLTAPCVADCDSLRTIPRRVLGRKRIGALGVADQIRLDAALRFALGIRT